MYLLEVTSCNDPGILPILNIIRNVITVIQIIAPIILIVWASIGIGSMVTDPEQKNGLKKIINKFIAAVVIFLIPVFVDAVMNIVAESVKSDNNSIATISSCWKDAKSYKSNGNGGFVDAD